VHSLLFQTQCFIICFILLSSLPILSLTGLNVNFRLVFPLVLVAKIGIVLELHGIALQKHYRMVLLLNCQNIKYQNWYCYFIAKIKNVHNWYWYFIVVKKSAMPNPASKLFFLFLQTNGLWFRTREGDKNQLDTHQLEQEANDKVITTINKQKQVWNFVELIKHNQVMVRAMLDNWLTN
jgi:hypothetical protein